MKLTKEQEERLKFTPDDKLKAVFPDFTRSFLREEKRKLNAKTIEETIDDDKNELLKDSANKLKEKKYRRSLSIINQLQGELDAALEIKKHKDTYTIKTSKGADSEATAFMVASDWHYEEQVKSATTNGVNSYNLDIADKRINKFFQNGLKLINICKRDVKIKTIVLALLGDFISGNIHEENLETGQLRPIDAIIAVQKRIMSGINFLLENSDCKLVIPCSAGNHSRITNKIRVATETGNSLESLMYHNLAMIYENNPRVEFVIGESYHTYVNVYGKVIRFHHGHSMKYNGGLGGITIPVNRAIDSWNKTIHAYLDVFGHWHKFFDGGNFVCNGSIIGFGAYSNWIKASFEEPKQAFFLIDRDRGKTIVAPILVDKD